MELKTVAIENLDGRNLILGQSDFIKSADDILHLKDLLRRFGYQLG